MDPVAEDSRCLARGTPREPVEQKVYREDVEGHVQATGTRRVGIRDAGPIGPASSKETRISPGLPTRPWPHLQKRLAESYRNHYQAPSLR